MLLTPAISINVLSTIISITLCTEFYHKIIITGKNKIPQFVQNQIWNVITQTLCFAGFLITQSTDNASDMIAGKILFSLAGLTYIICVRNVCLLNTQVLRATIALPPSLPTGLLKTLNRTIYSLFALSLLIHCIVFICKYSPISSYPTSFDTLATIFNLFFSIFAICLNNATGFFLLYLLKRNFPKAIERNSNDFYQIIILIVLSLIVDYAVTGLYSWVLLFVDSDLEWLNFSSVLATGVTGIHISIVSLTCSKITQLLKGKESENLPTTLPTSTSHHTSQQEAIGIQ